MKSAYAVSDLHMFCRRSEWESHLPAIHEAASKADLFVFNGDTFDFKWTSLPSVEETIERAIEFLRDFAAAYPTCRVHVNLGNHDHVQGFMDALEALSCKAENLTWHPYFLRVGSALFLHGDVTIRKMDHDKLERYRAGWLRRHRKQGRFKNQAYDAAFRARAHVAVSKLAFPRRLTMRRLSAYIDDIGHGAQEGIERVYFGHTHVPMGGHEYRGVTFHNGGAPMPFMEFSLLKAYV